MFVSLFQDVSNAIFRNRELLIKTTQ